MIHYQSSSQGDTCSQHATPFFHPKVKLYQIKMESFRQSCKIETASEPHQPESINGRNCSQDSPKSRLRYFSILKLNHQDMKTHFKREMDQNLEDFERSNLWFLRIRSARTVYFDKFAYDDMNNKSSGRVLIWHSVAKRDKSQVLGSFVKSRTSRTSETGAGRVLGVFSAFARVAKWSEILDARFFFSSAVCMELQYQLFTPELANQHAQKVLFTCVVYALSTTKYSCKNIKNRKLF